VWQEHDRKRLKDGEAKLDAQLRQLFKDSEKYEPKIPSFAFENLEAQVPKLARRYRSNQRRHHGRWEDLEPVSHISIGHHIREIKSLQQSWIELFNRQKEYIVNDSERLQRWIQEYVSVYFQQCRMREEIVREHWSEAFVAQQKVWEQRIQGVYANRK
jgi:hypothetical protein